MPQFRRGPVYSVDLMSLVSVVDRSSLNRFGGGIWALFYEREKDDDTFLDRFCSTRKRKSSASPAALKSFGDLETIMPAIDKNLENIIPGAIQRET